MNASSPSRPARLTALCIAASLACSSLSAPALAQYAELPDLGEPAESALSPAQERRIGEQILREIRLDRSYVDDADIADYLDALGNRLVEASSLRGQSITFLTLRDPGINAFAFPGGYIGMHTGTIMAAQTESELAGVLAHEIGHIEQRHIARSLAQQSGTTATLLASMLIAVLASRSSRSQVPEAAVAAGQALAMQNQLSYSRDFEREADRVGFQILSRAGMDVQGMPGFFERLRRAHSMNEAGAPSYLLTHPLTVDRLSDMQGRLRGATPRQVTDSLDFALVKARIEATQGNPRDVEARIRQRGGTRTHEAIARQYGLTVAALRANDPAAAEKSMAALRALQPVSAMVETLAAELARAQGRPGEAVQICRSAQARHPRSRSLHYCEMEALLADRQPAQVIAALRERIMPDTRDDRLYALRARAYEALGKPAEQHRALAEMYLLRGNLRAAVDQLQVAQRSGGGDYYEQAGIDARLRELRRRLEEEIREGRINPAEPPGR